MRDWSDETEQTLYPGSPSARGANGVRPSRRVCLAVGGHGLDRRQVGCTPETLRSWVRQAERDRGLRDGQTTEERERVKALERENRELKRANDILRKVSAYFAQAELDRRGK